MFLTGILPVCVFAKSLRFRERDGLQQIQLGLKQVAAHHHTDSDVYTMFYASKSGSFGFLYTEAQQNTPWSSTCQDGSVKPCNVRLVFEDSANAMDCLYNLLPDQKLETSMHDFAQQIWDIHTINVHDLSFCTLGVEIWGDLSLEWFGVECLEIHVTKIDHDCGGLTISDIMQLRKLESQLRDAVVILVDNMAASDHEGAIKMSTYIPGTSHDDTSMFASTCTC